MAKVLYFPDIKQNTNYTCGVVCVQAVMAYYGIEYTEEKLAKILKADNEYGTAISAITGFFRRKKFKLNSGDFSVEKIKNFLHRHIPVIILIQAWGPEGVDYRHTMQYGHYVVVSGYNKRGLIIEDPAIFGRGFISYAQLKKRWHGDDKKPIYNFGLAVWGKPRYDYSILYHIA